MRAFDRLLGVSTSESIITEESAFVAGGDFTAYAGCSWLSLRRALKDLHPCPSDVFVDLGSGKGKALLIAGRLPYQRVVGVELDKELVDYSKRNVECARPRLRARQVESVHANALEWPIPDDTSVVFMNCPFIGETFHDVVSRIIESYDLNPRNLHIVYSKPWEHDWLLSTGRVTVVSVGPRFWPTQPGWWRSQHVIVSYRVVRAPGDSRPEPQLPRRPFWRRQAMQRWSKPNGQHFLISTRDQTIHSHS